MFIRTTIPNLSVGAANLRRLCVLRGILIFVESAGLGLSIYLFQLSVPLLIPFVLLIINILVIALTLLRLHKSAYPIENREFFLQLLFDLFSQGLLFYFTGGYTNPFVSICLVSITIGAALLTTRYSWALTFTAIAIYTLLMNWYRPLTSSMSSELHSMQPSMDMISLHLMGMWFTFVISAALINYFVVLMATALRKQQLAIADARERQLRDESILAIASQAAGAAHELGTPLSTMAVLLNDLASESDISPEFSDDILLLRSQVDECKKRLNHLVNESQHEKQSFAEVKEFVLRVLDQWQLLRPGISPLFNPSGWQHDNARIKLDLTLYQAMIALLNNAADACPDNIEVCLSMMESNVIITINDQGPGISEDVAKQLGTALHSSKKSGMGLGYLLSQSSIERLGGQVRLYNRLPTGTRTEIILPVYFSEEAVDDC